MDLRVAMAQINPTVGDLAANVSRIADAAAAAKKAGAGLVVLPELAVTGYPPEDLLLRPHFIEANLRAIADVAKKTRGICAVVGFVDKDDDVYNAAAVCKDGEIAARYHKVYLPNYGVFDENRYFREGDSPLVVTLNGSRIGVTICEDVWQPGGPLRDAVMEGGAQAIVNLSSSPYSAGKRELRERMLATRASDNAVALVYTNLVGGQDELVFDGFSLAFNQEGDAIARAKGFEEDLVCVDLELDQVFRHRLKDLRHRQEQAMHHRHRAAVHFVDLGKPPARKGRRPKLPDPFAAPPRSAEEEIYLALVTGTRDYLRKNGFQKALVGLSGGVDSALTACVAADAVGANNVWTVFLPTRFSSNESYEDAAALAKNLGTRFDAIEIEKVFGAFEETLAPAFKKTKPDLTEENIQSRIRGTILMALSNKFGHLLLTTGNKSESSVGYATLYGDMAGGLAVIKDLPKVTVYAVCRDYNDRAGKETIPERILTKAPTAELRADQKDSDSLPEYDQLDPILRRYVEEDRSADQIVKAGYPRDVVDWVIRQVDLAEFKRRQAPPGIRITTRALGKDRRLPITNRFKGSY